MAEGVKAATLVLPDAQLYIVVAIFLAVASMIATDIRENKARLLPRVGLNWLALSLLIGAWTAASHIILVLIATNDPLALSTGSTLGMIVHSVVITLLLVVVSVWYRLVALHKETPAGNPTSPAAEQ